MLELKQETPPKQAHAARHGNQIYTVGLSHRTAPVEEREALAFTGQEVAQALRRLSEHLDSAVIISTCNRTELYTTGPATPEGPESLVPLLLSLKGVQLDTSRFYVHQHEAAVRHLYRVAAGVDSMVVGEGQILGQVRGALSAATDAGTLNGVLSRLFHTAIAVGRRARSETSISSYSASVSAAAVALANQTFGSLQDRRVLVISAGSTGKLAARSLIETGARISVTNRTYARAVAIAADLGGEAVAFERLPQALAEADVVISATGAGQFVVGPELVQPAIAGREDRPLMFIDIAVPRDIDPAVREIAGVALYDIDDLQAFTPSRNGHRSDIDHVEAIVEEEVGRFLAWWASLDAVPVIASLKEQAERIRRREVEKAFRKLPGLTEDEKQRVEAMTQAIINKLLHEPITRLKAGSDPGTHVEALQELFHLPPHRDSE